MTMYNIKTIADEYLGKKVILTISRENQTSYYLEGKIITGTIDNIQFESIDGENMTLRIREISFIQKK
ncbi:hypothetical protein ES705_18114 [subsurface metagenome]